jgi:hypothetical protein
MVHFVPMERPRRFGDSKGSKTNIGIRLPSAEGLVNCGMSLLGGYGTRNDGYEPSDAA